MCVYYTIIIFHQIKPKEIEEEAVTTITEEKMDRDTKDEIKVKLEIETEEKFEEKDKIKFVPEIATKLPASDVVTEVPVELPIGPETTIIETIKETAEGTENSATKQEIIDSSELHNL